MLFRNAEELSNKVAVAERFYARINSGHVQNV